MYSINLILTTYLWWSEKCHGDGKNESLVGPFKAVLKKYDHRKIQQAAVLKCTVKLFLKKKFSAFMEYIELHKLKILYGPILNL